MQTTTNQPQKVKFAAQSDPTVLEALRRMARAEGRQLQALIDEALRDYIERKQGLTLRKHMLAAFQASMSQYDSLYRKLAQ
jgi:predicted transcriptional regulator